MKAQRKPLKRPDIITQQLVDLYLQGFSTQKIAVKFGVVKSAISYRLKKAGVQLRTNSDYEKEKHWHWKGKNYLSPIKRKRNQRKHRKWSHSVMERDSKKCCNCGVEKVRLHAHHLISMKECINTFLEYDVNNGITLCVPCHGKRHKQERIRT